MISNIVRNIKSNKVRYFCLGVIFIIILLLSWLQDDSYHAHRMSWNLINGNGFVYNPGERVNATTAPLFTLVNTFIYYVIGSVYWSTMFLCIVCSMLAIYIMQRNLLVRNIDIVISTFILVFCNSFIKYTTSGLENSMLFLLSAIIIAFFLKNTEWDSKQLLLLSFVSSLLIATRMDNALIVIPLLVYVFLFKSKKRLVAILYGIIGMLPFITWILFATIYYGFPFPNTAYVKLNTGFPLTDYLERGIKYFILSGYNDALVLIIPLIYILYVLIIKDIKHILIALGIILYYMYVVYIGGDFLVGRHLTVPFFLSVFCIFDLLKQYKKDFTAIRAKDIIIWPVAFGLIFCMFSLSIKDKDSFPAIPKSLISVSGRVVAGCDRAGFHRFTSIIRRYPESKRYGVSPYELPLMAWGRDWLEPSMIQMKEIRESDKKGDILEWALGLMVYYGAQNKYFNDEIGLGDPLLARLPAIYKPDWYIGHMRRAIPAGYRESIQSGENKIVDPSLHGYYEILRLITRSEDLFAPERLKAIIDINLGKYDYLIDEYIQNTTHFE